MKLILKEGYLIERDPLNWILKKTYKGKRNGAECEVEKTIGYYSRLDDALERFLRLMRDEGKEDTVISFDEYLRQLKKADKENRLFLEGFLKGLQYGRS